YGPHRLYEGGAAVSGLRSLRIRIDAGARGANGGDAVWHRRKKTLPTGFCSLLTTGVFCPRAKREVARVMTSLASVSVLSIQQISIGEWLRAHVVDGDVMPLMLALVRYTTYCGDADQLSAAAAIEQLQLSLRGSILYVHNGWGTLVDNLEEAATAAGATILRGKRVVAVNIVDGRAIGV